MNDDETPDFSTKLIRAELTMLRKRQEAIESKLDQLVMVSAELKIYLKYNPDQVLEKLLPFFNEIRSAREKNSSEAKPYQKFQPERNDAWSWKEHILFTLFYEDRPLTTAELVEIHILLEVKGKKEGSYVLKDISKNLTDLVKDSRVIKYRAAGLGKYFYCLPQWMKGEELKPDYWGKGPFL
ncbi:MAG: hypothetical protein H6581_17560 [Bacteroidia bacterium]|nr:hypothetical protein [Bacteroidia bacterium]